MYHQFIPNKSISSNLNQKLRWAINYYKKYAPQQSVLDLPYTNTITITHSLWNPTHKSQLFVLSNNKVLRYDFKLQQISELAGLEQMQISHIKILELGHIERYLVLTEYGVVICSLLGSKGITNKTIHKVNKMLVEEHRQQEMMEQQGEAQQMIRSMRCEVQHSMFLDLFLQADDSRQTLLQQLKHSKHQQQVQSANIFVVANRQESKQSQQGARCLFVVVEFRQLVKQNRQLIVYRVTCEKSQHNQTTSERITLKPITYPNSKGYIELAFCDFPVPIIIAQQQKYINPVQLTVSNAKFSKCNLLVSCDCHSVIYKDTQTFSLYYVTQIITDEMEPNQNRHYVFQIQLNINDNNAFCLSQSLSSPIYEYPQKQVLCPSRVFCLPPSMSTDTLRFLNVQKTIHPIQILNSEGLCSPIPTLDNKLQQLNTLQTYKLKTLSMSIGNGLNYEQLECTIGNKEQLLDDKKRYIQYFNQQDRVYYVKVCQNLLLRDVVLLDTVKRYVVFLVSQGSVEIRRELLVDSMSGNKSQLRRSMKIVVVDLRQKQDKLAKRIASEYQLPQEIGEVLCSLQLDLPTDFQPIARQPLHTNSNQVVSQSSINKPKQMHLTCTNIPKQGQICHIIQLIPKSCIYHQMLDKLFNKLNTNHQSNSQAIINQSSTESFFANIISSLTI